MRAAPRAAPVCPPEPGASGSQALRRADRLRGRNAFAPALTRGRRQSGSVSTLLWVERDTPTAPARIGVVVPKKLAARAVDRARCKRLVREAFRRADPRWKGVDVVVRVVRRARADARLDTSLIADLMQFFSSPPLRSTVQP